MGIRFVRASDADALFSLVYNSPLTNTLGWDGPESLEKYRHALRENEKLVRRGEKHFFTILNRENHPIGSASVRPDGNFFRGDIGLWIGAPYHGQGYGTETVAGLVRYGFEKLGMQKIDSCVFVGNWASRRIFEKNGFVLEGTIRKAVLKRGKAVDEWMFGLTHEDYLRQQTAGSDQG